LRRLDEETLEQVEDDDVDDEIEQTDVCRERIQAAIIDVTTAIDGRKARLAMPAVTSIETTDVESSEVPTSVPLNLPQVLLSRLVMFPCYLYPLLLSHPESHIPLQHQ